MCHKWHDKEEEDPMQLRYFFLTILLFLVSVYFGFAQQSTVPEGTIVHLAEEPINDIEYSPDGELLAVASDSGIWLYDAVTHQEVRRLVGHSGLVNSISFSPDSTKLASGVSDGRGYLWDVATGTRLWSRDEIIGSASVSFSPGGQTLAIGGYYEINLLNVATWRLSLVSSLYGGEFDFQSVSFSPDGRMLALGNVDGRVFLYDVRSGRIRHTLEGHTDSVLSVAFNSSGLIVASSGLDQTVRLWDVITGELRHTLQEHTYDVNSVSFRPDGRILASAGDRTVRLWSVITGEPLRTFHGHTGWVNSASFSPDGKTLASAGSDAKILLWSVGWPAADINRDDKVNILDLVLIANEFGKVGENDADVNGDGIVDIRDLVLVAGAIGENAAAPLALSRKLKDVVSRAEVQKWLSEIQQLILTDTMSQRGILFLEHLLTALTPKETALLPNYPNPFNPETWIPYQFAQPAEVTLTIYVVNVRTIRTFDLGHQHIGIYQSRDRAAHWDGRNAQGETVASGVYFYTLTAGEFSATRKLLIRK